MKKLLFDEVTHSTDETEALGARIAELARREGIDFAALYGDLGTGKTALTRGIASVYAPGAYVRSPTFTIVNEYTAACRNETSLPVFHFDMYRVTDEDSLDSIGFYDYFARGGFIVTEWSENIPWALPEEYIEVKLERLSDDERRITAVVVGRERKDDETC